MDLILKELRDEWANMKSVIQNTTVPEFWNPPSDAYNAEYAHNGVSALSTLFLGIAGIRPPRPGFTHARIQPQLGGLDRVALTAHTVHGPILFEAEKAGDSYEMRVDIPPGMQAELWLPRQGEASLERLTGPRHAGPGRFALKTGSENRFNMKPGRAGESAAK